MTTTVNRNRRDFLKVLAAWVLLAVMILSAALPIAAAYPKKDGNVADEAGVLSENTIRSLKKNNDTLKADIGVSIALCTVKTTGETSIEEYARGLFKSWNLGDGVLILIAVEDEDYYFIQSKGIEKVITNDVLASVRDNYFEDDFLAGNIDRGVIKTVSNLSTELVSRLKESAKAEAEKAEEEKTDDSETEGEGTTVGSFIVGVFKFILVLALIALLAFAALFVAALFNDDCAEIMRTYVFRRGQNRTPAYNYDERLYGRQSAGQQAGQQRRPQQRRPQDPYAQNRQILDQRRSNPAYNPHRTNYGGQLDPYAQNPRQPQPGVQRGYTQNPQNGAYRNNSLPAGYNQNGVRTYYNADGTQRQQNARPVRQQQYAQQQYAQNSYSQQNQRPQQRYRQPEMNGEETRAFTIPGRGNN